MPKRLFATKPVGELHEADTSNELRRTLDARALVLLGIGAIIARVITVPGAAASPESVAAVAEELGD